MVSCILTGASVLLQGLGSHILSSMRATSSFPLITLFFIQSNLACCPHIQRTILVSITVIFYVCAFIVAILKARYSFLQMSLWSFLFLRVAFSLNVSYFSVEMIKSLCTGLNLDQSGRGFGQCLYVLLYYSLLHMLW